MKNVEAITACNMAEIVHKVFRNCLFEEGEDTSSMILVDGISTKYGFSPKKIKENRQQIQELVNKLPAQFKEGYSFLSMCFNKYGEQWGEHPTCELLMTMAVAADIMAYCLPHKMWDIFPGGVPYVILK